MRGQPDSVTPAHIVEAAGQQQFAKGGPRHVEPLRAEVGHRRQRGERECSGVNCSGLARPARCPC
jgi:hypothetical protein